MKILPVSKTCRTRAFEDQITPHVNYLDNLAHRFTGNHSDAEDVLQEVLVKLFHSHARWETADNPRPYFARAVYNQFIDHIRKHGKHTAHTDIEDCQLPAEPNNDNRPELATDYEITLDRLRQAMACLTPDHRAVIVLHDIQGLTYEEIGDIQGTPVGTAKSRHNRARRALAELL